MKINHWMTFSTFAEQRFFIYPTPETYKGVIINANMVAHAPGGMAGFLIEKTKSLKFIVDPLTHAFQHDIKYIMSGEGVKSSIDKLAKEYGNPFLDKVGKYPIKPADFKDTNKRKKMVTRCIDFQRNKLQKSKSTQEVDKYLSDSEQTLSPYCLISPYFYLTEINYEGWLPIIKSCADDALSIKEQNEKLFIAIVISKGVLEDKIIVDNIIDNYPSVDGFLIWVDNFDEQSASISQLKNFIYLCKKLKTKANEVINLHGGYFSILIAGKLGGSILSGVAHGPEFGEYRSVIPVGGGIPIAKYYIPNIHARIKYRDALNIFHALKWLEDHENFYKNVCSCSTCKKVIVEDIKNFLKFGNTTSKATKRNNRIVRLEYPTKETKEICLKHYLNVKKKEYSMSYTLTKEQLLSQLENSREIFEPVTGIDFISYLVKWHKVLSVNNH